MKPLDLLGVFVGAGLGGVARYGLSLWMLEQGRSSSLALVVINVAGSLLFGFLYGLWADRHPGPLAFLGAGVLGGFTTFSAFSVEALLLLRKGDTVGAAVFVGVSVVASLLGAAAGLALGYRLRPSAV